ncbi:MAG TPA: FHA domain-containing protein [Planctomycetota bacterium]|jgi:hypothetical protein
MAKLFFKSGQYTGKSATLAAGKTITAGRSRDLELPLPDLKLSRRHCQFIVQTDRCLLRDMGSTNGTYVNGSRLTGEIDLHDGDRVVVGDTEMEFRLSDKPQGSPESAADSFPDEKNRAPVHSGARTQPAAQPHGGGLEGLEELEELSPEPVAAPAPKAASAADALTELDDLDDLDELVPEPAPKPAAPPPQPARAPLQEAQAPSAGLDDFALPEPVPLPKTPPRPVVSALPNDSDPLLDLDMPQPAAVPKADSEPSIKLDPLSAAIREMCTPLPPEPPELKRNEPKIERPKIIFCESCQGSIPMLDVDLGLARPIGGKTYCKECLAKSTPAAAAPKPPEKKDDQLDKMLAALDQDAVVVDTTFRRRGKVVSDEEMARRLGVPYTPPPAKPAPTDDRKKDFGDEFEEIK